MYLEERVRRERQGGQKEGRGSDSGRERQKQLQVGNPELEAKFR